MGGRGGGSEGSLVWGGEGREGMEAVKMGGNGSCMGPVSALLIINEPGFCLLAVGEGVLFQGVGGGGGSEDGAGLFEGAL